MTQRYCTMKLPVVAPIAKILDTLSPGRQRLLLESRTKWMSGETLNYWFFDEADRYGETVYLEDGTTEWRTWAPASDAEADVVREAFEGWRSLGIGLTFQERPRKEGAHLRIGFMQGDGAWSYVGRDVLAQGADERTMNFGWSLVAPKDLDTALHEIGHSLGLPHEHQSPKAGIEWDEEAVYAALAAPPNMWSRTTTYDNILRKFPADTVQGSSWDPNSIMHYPFAAGLIVEPKQYRNGLTPAGGLSSRDQAWVRAFYPQTKGTARLPALEPLVSAVLDLPDLGQQDFSIRVTETRTWEIRAFGKGAVVLALFEPGTDGEPAFVAGSKETGSEENAVIRTKLSAGRDYILRVRQAWSERRGGLAVMLA